LQFIDGRDDFVSGNFRNSVCAIKGMNVVV